MSKEPRTIEKSRRKVQIDRTAAMKLKEGEKRSRVREGKEGGGEASEGRESEGRQRSGAEHNSENGGGEGTEAEDEDKRTEHAQFVSSKCLMSRAGLIFCVY